MQPNLNAYIMTDILNKTETRQLFEQQKKEEKANVMNISSYDFLTSFANRFQAALLELS